MPVFLSFRLLGGQVNMIKSNGEVIHFANPKVQAAIAANTFSITGLAEIKQITELLPDIIPQLGPESIEGLKALAAGMGSMGGGAPGALADPESEEEDVPGRPRLRCIARAPCRTRDGYHAGCGGVRVPSHDGCRVGVC